MGNVLHRVTRVYRESVNTPDFPASEWLINPVLPKGVPTKYLVINPDDTVSEMTALQKQAVRAAEEKEQKDRIIGEFDMGERAADMGVLLQFLNDIRTHLRLPPLSMADFKAEYRSRL